MRRTGFGDERLILCFQPGGYGFPQFSLNAGSLTPSGRCHKGLVSCSVFCCNSAATRFPKFASLAEASALPSFSVRGESCSSDIVRGRTTRACAPNGSAQRVSRECGIRSGSSGFAIDPTVTRLVHEVFELPWLATSVVSRAPRQDYRIMRPPRILG